MAITRLQTLSAAAVLLAAGAASAQVARNGITILVDDPVLEPGQSTTIRMEAYFDARDYAMERVVTSLRSSAGAQGLSEPRVVGSLAGAGSSGGMVDAGGVGGIIAGQLHGIGEIYGDPTNPIAFWEATYTAPVDVAAPFEVRLMTETIFFDVYLERASSGSESRLDDLAEGEATIRVVPAPAGVVALGGLLVAVGRRRESRRIASAPIASPRGVGG
ncbi:MAG: hypothetical protein RIE77_08385 [Phycisphaerales bacterium]|jgi:hypothetical protein